MTSLAAYTAQNLEGGVFGAVREEKGKPLGLSGNPLFLDFDHNVGKIPRRRSTSSSNFIKRKLRQNTHAWHVQQLSCVCLFVTPWTVASQAPLCVEFPRWEYWSQLLYSLPGDLPDTGIKSCLVWILNSQADSLPVSYLRRSRIDGDGHKFVWVILG